MKQKILRVNGDLLLNFFKLPQSFKLIKGIPLDSKVKNTYYDSNCNEWCVVIESKEFDNLLDGSFIPAILPEFKKIKLFKCFKCNKELNEEYEENKFMLCEDCLKKHNETETNEILCNSFDDEDLEDF